jgi:parvulin-like peptidyl-prolyl isomerase
MIFNADLTEQQPPLEADLQAYFDSNQDRFRLPARFSFHQIYLNPAKHTGDLRRKADELLRRLTTEASSAVDPNMIGDATLMPARLDAVTQREVANTFGREFAKNIENAPTGRWSGPYASSFGLHLVHITDREAGGLPTITEIRPILEREWYTERRKEANERLYQAIRERYDIEIRLPAGSSDKTLAQR